MKERIFIQEERKLRTEGLSSNTQRVAKWKRERFILPGLKDKIEVNEKLQESKHMKRIFKNQTF